jgi:hypothetical protein
MKGAILVTLRCNEEHSEVGDGEPVTMKTSGSNKPITIRGEKKLYYEYHCPECKKSVWVVVKDRTSTLMMDEDD